MSNGNYVGPYCNLNAKQNVEQPTAPSLPQIPIATDLASAIQAVNNMRQIVMMMTNQLGTPGSYGNANNSIAHNGQPGKAGASASPGGGASAASGGNFTQVPGSLQTKTVKVTNPEDNSQFVMVKQITGVSFQNKLGQTLTYSNPD